MEQNLDLDEIINVNNEEKCYSAIELEIIKTKIEKINKCHHVEILKILKEFNSVKLNENKSGVFVNLSFLPYNVIDKLNNYIDYINDQENTISKLENQKENFKNSFFIEKEDKDKHIKYSIYNI